MGTTVVMGDVIEALELAADEMSSYVSSKTGEVIIVTAEELRLEEEESDLESSSPLFGDVAHSQLQV